MEAFLSARTRTNSRLENRLCGIIEACTYTKLNNSDMKQTGDWQTIAGATSNVLADTEPGTSLVAASRRVLQMCLCRCIILHRTRNKRARWTVCRQNWQQSAATSAAHKKKCILRKSSIVRWMEKDFNEIPITGRLWVGHKEVEEQDIKRHLTSFLDIHNRLDDACNQNCERRVYTVTHKFMQFSNSIKIFMRNTCV